MRPSARWWGMLALAAMAAGGAAAQRRPAPGLARIEYSPTLETVMLLAQLASPGPAAGKFQEQAREQFALRSTHAAVRETAALLERGLTPQDLARLSTFMALPPSFELRPSEELNEMASLLPGGNVTFNLDRLHGYARLVREFYRDAMVARFLRDAAPYYQEIARRQPPADAPAGAKILVSPLAPVDPFQFVRRSPRPVTYLILGL